MIWYRPDMLIKRRPRAFTLIEMMLVVVLIAIMTGTVVVSLSGRQDAHALRIATADLAASLRYAAEQARLTGMPHRVAFRDGYSEYRVEVGAAGSSDEYEAVIGQGGRWHALPDSVVIVDVRDAAGGISELPETFMFDTNVGFSGVIGLENRLGERAEIESVSQGNQINVVQV